MASLLWKRQSLNNDNDNDDLDYYGYDNWWWSPVSSHPPSPTSQHPC